MREPNERGQFGCQECSWNGSFSELDYNDWNEYRCPDCGSYRIFEACPFCGDEIDNDIRVCAPCGEMV